MVYCYIRFSREFRVKSWSTNKLGFREQLISRSVDDIQIFDVRHTAIVLPNHLLNCHHFHRTFAQFVPFQSIQEIVGLNAFI